jgi:hypothetical protein
MQMSTPITEAELNALRATKNEQDWNKACDVIKKARDGSYPPDWWAKVKLSGLMDSVFAGWEKPGSSEIQIVPITNDELLSGKF